MRKTGLISNIQRYSLDDGPGIRSTVFFVGCNLKCKWCSNPELISFEKKTLEFLIGDKIETQVVGSEISVDDLVNEIKRDKVFFDESGGGVTLSGGDPLLQFDFVLKLAKTLKKEGIKVAIDTAGNISNERFIEIANNVDTILFDIKHTDTIKHFEGTGVNNELIFKNALIAKKYCNEVIVRLVVIPNYNDSFEELKNRIDFAKEMDADRVDFLIYHELGLGKYKALNIDYKMQKNREIDNTSLKKAFNYAKEIGLNVFIK